MRKKSKVPIYKPKVMLINPPQLYYSGSRGFNVYFLLGILSIAAVIESKCNLKIFDCLVENFQISKKGKTTRYGTSLINIEKQIRDFNPDIVGISCPFSAQLKNSINIANLCKKINPEILVILGGPDASVRGKYILSKSKSIDICVLGEGEYTLLEIIESFKKGYVVNPERIKGIIYRRRKKILRSENRRPIVNLDKLPFPAYEKIDFKKYLNNPYLYVNRSKINKKSISMITSRGCPYSCVFCSINLHMGKFFRGNSPNYILKHLQLVIEKYGIKNFHFEDDNISFQRDRFAEIIDQIIKNNINIKWDTPNGVRADTLSFDLLKKIKQSGCVDLTIGVESGNQRVLDNIIRKNLSLKQVIKIAKMCKKIKLSLSAFYVIGFPGEKIKDMKETIDFATSLYKKYSVRPILMIATPLYGTKLYEICERNNLFSYPLKEEYLAQGTQLHGRHLIKTDDFDEKDIDDLIKDYKVKLFEITTFRKQTHKIND